jgi:CDP-glycerol glycerophosphotransferase
MSFDLKEVLHMKVSLIIPFHKGLTFLEDTLQSLKDQTFRDNEIILICDHIEENIDLLLDTYQAELELKVHYLCEKTGVAAARNYGLSFATGEYIYFLDSDDYLDYNTLEILVSAAELENADIIYGRMIRTWFKRSTFLTSQEYNKDNGNDDAENDSESDSDLSDMDLRTGDIIEMENTITDEISINEDHLEMDPVKILQENRNKAYKYLVSRKKGIRNISVLNILMKRALITEYNIRFNENIIFLSDYPFIFQILHHAASFHYEKNAVYMKRNHNDPINFPSLSQRYGSKDFMEYINAYRYTIGLAETNTDLRKILDGKILKFYASSFAPKLHRAPDIIELSDRFHEIHLLVQKMDKEIIGKYHGYKRRLFKALKVGNFKKSISTVKFHLAWIKIKKIIKNKRELSKALYLHIFLKKRLKENWVLCESFFGKSYSDNPKYIYEYISRNYSGKFKFIWVIDRKNTKIPYKHTKVKRFSILYCYYLARSKYYIFNGRQPEWVRKRNGNVFLQTWHGTPLKRLAFDMEDISSATASYKKQVFQQSRAWDYLIAPNKFSSEIFKKCFLYDKEMLETGYPRNDILHSENKEQLAEKIKLKLGLPQNKKIILYAPTWRDDEYYAKGKYKFSLQLDLQLLKESLSYDYIILLRTHYFIADNLDISDMDDFVYNMSNYDDIAELYLISDILITDYSSVFFDYANLRRPMLFFMYDLEKYRDILRGFYIDIEEELPGPLLFTTEEVLEAIRKIKLMEQMYRDKYLLFYNKYCAWENGNASELVANRAFNLNMKSRDGD